MRFESKLSYFKRCVRNLCLTLHERHQMLHAYLSAGSVSACLPFSLVLYSQAIQDAVMTFDFTETNTKVNVAMLYKGTSYKKGQFLDTGNTDSLEFGELVLILIKELQCSFSGVNVPRRIPSNERMQCLNISDLIDFYPMPSCMKNGYQLIPLNHSALSH